MLSLCVSLSGLLRDDIFSKEKEGKHKLTGDYALILQLKYPISKKLSSKYQAFGTY